MPPLTYSSEELAAMVRANSRKIEALEVRFSALEKLIVKLKFANQQGDKAT